MAHMAVKPLRLPPIEHKDDPSTLIPRIPSSQPSFDSKVAFLIANCNVFETRFQGSHFQWLSNN
jgi:hypothetical protein